MSRHDDLVRLRHMRDFAEEAKRMAASRVQAELQSDRMLQLALTHLVEMVGEAACRVSQETTKNTPQIPWAQVTGMRHRIVHGYDRVDFKILWQTIIEDFPPLIDAVDELIARMDRATPEDS